VVASLTTHLNMNARDNRHVRAALQEAVIEEYERLTIPNGGDIIRSSGLARADLDSRNSSWVRVRVLSITLSHYFCSRILCCAV
jgi:hypothetical protein